MRLHFAARKGHRPRVSRARAGVALRAGSLFSAMALVVLLSAGRSLLAGETRGWSARMVERLDADALAASLPEADAGAAAADVADISDNASSDGRARGHASEAAWQEALVCGSCVASSRPPARQSRPPPRARLTAARLCPLAWRGRHLDVTHPKLAVALLCWGIFYMFLALASVCDDYFVQSLEVRTG